MTYTELRRALISALQAAKEATALDIGCDYEADEILRLRAHLSRADRILRAHETVDADICRACLDVAKQRAVGTPLAYLLGCAPFFGRDFCVKEGCLVPRADTEVLVEEAMRLLPQNSVFWDLCTGSGCIPISILSERTDITHAYAFDLYDVPLHLARENAARMSVSDRLTVMRANVLEGELPSGIERPSVIVSNPPYIAQAVCKTLDTEVQKEPITALCGGEDGLDFYRAILTHYAPHLKENGHLLFEIGYDQGNALCDLAAAFGYRCEIRQDYTGHDRVAILSA